MTKFKLSNYYFVLTIFFLWRIALFIVSLASSHLFTFTPSFPYSDEFLTSSKLPDWLWTWGNFDGVHYLTLAKVWYDGFGTQVFFPFFPILIALLTKLLGSELVSGLVISNISILLAGMVLYNFVLEKFNEKTAKWTTIFLFCFPTSFFFGALYPEALLLLLILLSFQIRGLWGGIFSGLASGTKLIGAFIGPLLVTIKPRNFWGILGVTGIVVYMIYLWQKFNSPLMFLSAQSAFANNRASDLTHLVLPPQVIFRYLKIFVTANWQHLDYWVAMLEFAAFAFGIFALVILTRKKVLPKNIMLFSWLALLLPVFSGTLSSMPRYLLPIFPLYIYLAKITNVWLKTLLLLVFILLSIVLTALFIQGNFIS